MWTVQEEAKIREAADADIRKQLEEIRNLIAMT
jgi:hypothetical protein